MIHDIFINIVMFVYASVGSKNLGSALVQA